MRLGAALAAAALLIAPAWAAANPGSGTGPAPPLAGVVEALAAADPAHPGASVAHVLRAIARAEGREVPPLGSCPGLGEALALHAARAGLAAPSLPPVAPALAEPLGCLLGALHEANLARDATFAGISDRELMAHAARETWTPELEALLAGRDRGLILASAIRVADAVELALPALRALPRASLAPIDLPPLLSFDPGVDNVYDMTYALQVDLAGDDVYDNTAGGIVAVVGNGIYTARDEQVHAGPVLGWQVGVGGDIQDGDFVLSSGLVLDLEGDDTYGVKAPPVFEDDQGCTADPIVSVPGTIGAGITGVGMLFDLGGTNAYVGRTQTQGAGHLLGVGVLYAPGGVDTYEALRAAQGSGMLGGIGLLLDAGGDDVYLGTSPAGGVFNGDILVCDDEPRYLHGAAFGRRTGPAPGVIGILADLDGDDRYLGANFGQGFGQGEGFGLLYEPRGDDVYQAGDRAQGASQGRLADLFPQSLWGAGLGILLDEAGNDAYSMATARGQGWSLGASLTPLPGPFTVGEWLGVRGTNEAVGVFLDLDGADAYAGVPGRADGATVVENTLAVFHDAA